MGLENKIGSAKPLVKITIIYPTFVGLKNKNAKEIYN